MKNTTDLDLIIVGQGLAGSAVAMRALDRGYRILVIDQPSNNSSSVIAAGLFNPVTGRKMVKTWLADELFPTLLKFYRECEQRTGRRFLHVMPVYRPFLNVEEQNEWMSKSADASYEDYIDEVSHSAAFENRVHDPYGGITLKQAGYLDARVYLEAVREYLTKNNALKIGTFDAKSLKIETDSITYDGAAAKRIIFCQGVANASNPWFKHLPVNSLKGEFLAVQCDWKNDVILNRGVYMVPAGISGEWRVGATYNWNDHDPGTTHWAKAELIGKLEAILRIPYTVKGQQWGFRPTTPDRKPIIGAHPDFPSLIIFNGLGTKGVSLAPYFSEVLFRWMENKGTIRKEADVTRFN